MTHTVLPAGLAAAMVLGLATGSGGAGPMARADNVIPDKTVVRISFTQLARSILGDDDDYNGENACGGEPADKSAVPEHSRERHAGPPKDGAFPLASWLSAQETIVGIQSAQLDAWRRYTSTLLAFVDRSPAGPGTESLPEKPRDEPGKPHERPPLTADRMADLAIERGAKAQIFKQARTALLEVWTPDQQAMFLDSERKHPWAPHRVPPRAQ